MPVLLDELSNQVDQAYAAPPERHYFIDQQGVIVWPSGTGPWGFELDGWNQAIRDHIGTG